MNFIARFPKVFAVLLLIFAAFLTANAQGNSIYRLPAGTKITLRIDGGVNSKASSVNDTFRSMVTKPVTVGDVVVLNTGTVIEGRVVDVSSAGFGRKNGRMELRFETMLLAGDRKRAIDGVLAEELEPEASVSLDVASIGGGAAAGALIGSASGRDGGTFAGAGIGAGIGTAISLLRKGKDVYLRSDEEFEIELKSEVTLPANDY